MRYSRFDGLQLGLIVERHGANAEKVHVAVDGPVHTWLRACSERELDAPREVATLGRRMRQLVDLEDVIGPVESVDHDEGAFGEETARWDLDVVSDILRVS